MGVHYGLVATTTISLVKLLLLQPPPSSSSLLTWVYSDPLPVMRGMGRQVTSTRDGSVPVPSSPRVDGDGVDEPNDDDVAVVVVVVVVVVVADENASMAVAVRVYIPGGREGSRQDHS